MVKKFSLIEGGVRRMGKHCPRVTWTCGPADAGAALLVG
jgi:hypothetical protein